MEKLRHVIVKETISGDYRFEVIAWAHTETGAELIVRKYNDRDKGKFRYTAWSVPHCSELK